MYTTHPHPCILSGKLAMDSNMCIECKMLCQVAWTVYISILTFTMDADIVAIFLLCAFPCVYEELDAWLTMKTEAYACRNNIQHICVSTYFTKMFHRLRWKWTLTSISMFS